MSDATDHLLFAQDSTEQWLAPVEKELKGKSYEDHLIWKSAEGFTIESWQNSLPTPLAQLTNLEEPWKIVEPIYEKDAQKANEEALAALNQGAEAIWFFKGFLGAAAEVALRGIDTGIAPAFVQGGNCIDPYRELLRVKGDTDFSKAGNLLLNGKRLRNRGAGLIDEVAFLLAQGLETGKTNGFDAPILFHTGVGNAFLSEIAKVRALRWLWTSILRKEGKEPRNPMILASNLTITNAKNDEHSNILRATSSAMSAVLGGAQFVMVEPWDLPWKESNNFRKRISRNIQNLLKEEGRLDKNLNQADGAYLIEHLTTTIAEKAWERVQEIEAAGGFTAYAKSGELRRNLETSGKALVEAYENGERNLLGVNKYPPSTVLPETPRRSTEYALLPAVIDLPLHLQSVNA